MNRTITVRFAAEREYEFMVSEEEATHLIPEAAQRWLASQIEALECPPPDKRGNLLAADIALTLAQCAGEALFVQGGEWAQSYAQALAALFDRPVVVVDLDQCRISCLD